MIVIDSEAYSTTTMIWKHCAFINNKIDFISVDIKENQKNIVKCFCNSLVEKLKLFLFSQFFPIKTDIVLSHGIK